MVAFVLVPGMASMSTAQAQGWGRYERDRDWQRDRGGYDNYGRYGGNYNRDVQKGYRDGLDRGQEDARDGRARLAVTRAPGQAARDGQDRLSGGANQRSGHVIRP